MSLLAKPAPLSRSSCWLPAPARPRGVLGTALALLLLCFTLLAAVRCGGKALRHAVRALYYTTDPLFLGRDDGRFPSPSCCRGAECAQERTGRVAVLTYLQGEAYLPLLQQLECTLRRSNPGLELGVMLVRGEQQSPTVLSWLDRKRISRVQVEPLSYTNHFDARYGSNFMKVRALGLTQYDAIILLDSDVAVAGDLSPLFSLPTEFAAVWDQPKVLGRFGPHLQGINGGMLLLRPCKAVMRHMLAVLEAQPKLRFSHGAAEQDFFHWYFKYTGMRLPLEYNTMASDSLAGNRTLGGRDPVVVHFTRNKPFHGPQPGRPGHQFLCRLEEMD
ncbi:hypothetical protein COHA_000252 [Chlorella ohadii]|uniref:Hexosyltransferase n=1 Tax=Chlorella ohadii TaxID=2649997 RepID=A0AAD5DXD2_9CHLO|nr:hypothetical protein COHA_000252 [Chlorella ohadii]